MSNWANSRPANIGPKTRLTLLTPTSTDKAGPMRCAPTESPIIMRRTGLSAAQQIPLIKQPTPKCQMLSQPMLASSAKTPLVNKEVPTISIKDKRESKRSANAPIKAPNKPMGNKRNMLSSATMKADSVTR